MITTVTLNPAIDKLYVVDDQLPGTVMRVSQVCNSAGGKGLNVAKVAALLGEPVCATGFLGGFNGQFIRSRLAQAGIRAEFCETAGETRCCLNIRDRAAGTHTEYLEPGCPVTEQNLDDFRALFQRLLADSACVTISGSAPAGTPAGFYAELIARCHAAGRPILVDTSGGLLRESIGAQPTLIKPNIDETAQLLGSRAEHIDDCITAARRLHQRGAASYIILSMGANGAVLACAQGVFRALPPAIKAVNTVGCGDSMMAGLAVGLLRGYDAAGLLRFATAVSAANALELPTGHIEAANLPNLLAATVVTQLD